MPDSQRLIEIESQLARLGRHIETLGEVVIDQGRAFEGLKRLLDRLEARMDRIEAGIESGRKALGDQPEESPWKDPEM